MSLPDLGADIERMTAYCTYCPKMCRFSCPTADAESRETATPWGMMRLLEMVRDGSVPIDDDVADAFYHCTGCRRCQSYCEHDNDVPRALWKARKWAVDTGFLPEAYQELYRRFEESNTPYGEPDAAIDESIFDAQASVALWPDCSTVANQPALVEALGRLLERLWGRKVRLVQSDDMEHPPCCGFPLTGAGIEDPDSCRDNWWPQLEGVEQVWTDCPALAAWHADDASWSVDGEEGPEMAHIFEFLASKLPQTEPEQRLDASEVLLHESCYISRQLDGLEDVAAVVEHIAEEPPQKMAYQGAESPCCGGRCHYRQLEPEASKRAAEKIVDAVDRKSGATRLATTSSMCRSAIGDTGDSVDTTTVLEMVCRAYDCL